MSRRSIAGAFSWPPIGILDQAPITITAFHAPRSLASRHDSYSKADYWWLEPADPKGPYIRRDGFSNPDKFTAHRDALIGLGVKLPALAAAFRVSGYARYAEHA